MQVLAYGFINLKTLVRMQNLTFVPTYTFRMKSTGSFINEAPWCDKISGLYIIALMLFFSILA